MVFKKIKKLTDLVSSVNVGRMTLGIIAPLAVAGALYFSSAVNAQDAPPAQIATSAEAEDTNSNLLYDNMSNLQENATETTPLSPLEQAHADAQSNYQVAQDTWNEVATNNSRNSLTKEVELTLTSGDNYDSQKFTIKQNPLNGEFWTARIDNRTSKANGESTESTNLSLSGGKDGWNAGIRHGRYGNLSVDAGAQHDFEVDGTPVHASVYVLSEEFKEETESIGTTLTSEQDTDTVGLDLEFAGTNSRYGVGVANSRGVASSTDGTLTASAKFDSTSVSAHFAKDTKNGEWIYQVNTTSPQNGTSKTTHRLLFNRVDGKYQKTFGVGANDYDENVTVEGSIGHYSNSAVAKTVRDYATDWKNEDTGVLNPNQRLRQATIDAIISNATTQFVNLDGKLTMNSEDDSYHRGLGVSAKVSTLDEDGNPCSYSAAIRAFQKRSSRGKKSDGVSFEFNREQSDGTFWGLQYDASSNRKVQFSIGKKF